MIHPGPPSIDADSAPGGVVIHVYAVPTNRLLITSRATTMAEAAYRAGLDGPAAMDALREGEEAVCLVAYDGDSGTRYDLTAWTGGGANEH